MGRSRVPDDLSGTGVSLAARVSHVAEACEVFQRTAGIEAALDMVRSRSGTHFDPEIAQLVTDRSRVLVRGPRPGHRRRGPRRRPGGTRAPLTDDELDQALEAIGDFCDLRCPYFAGHARATADLVRGAAELMHMPAATSVWPTVPP